MVRAYMQGMETGRQELRRWLTRVFFACVLLFGVWARAGEPRITCEEPSFDFGVVLDKQQVKHAFALKNDGDAELVIEKVTTSCGCTTASLARHNLAPGESVDIEATFSLRGRSGHQKKAISVRSNDPLSPLLSLQLSGDIRRSIEVNPVAIAFGRVEIGMGAEKTVSLSSISGTVFRVTGVVTSEVSFCDVRLDTVAEGSEYSISCALRTNAVPNGGPFTGLIVVHTDNSLYPEIEIRVSGIRDHELVAIPSRLTFSQKALNPAPLIRHLLVRSGNRKPFEVLAVKTPLESIQAEIKQLPGNRSRVLISNMVASDELNGKQIEIDVRKWNGEETTLTVPIRVVGAPASHSASSGR